MSFQPSQIQISFDVVSLKDTSMTISADKSQYQVGETATITVKVSEKLTLIAVGGITVNFLVDGTPFSSAITDILGTAVFKNIFSVTGTRAISAQFAGNAIYSASQASTSISVIAITITTALTITLNKATYSPGENVTATMRLTRTDTGAGLNNAPIIVTLDTTQQGVAVNTDASGNATKTFPAPQATGPHKVIADFLGGTGFALAEATTGFTLGEIPIDPRLLVGGLVSLGAIGLIWLSTKKKKG